MDKKQLIAWIVAAVARGLAWGLSGWLGFEATQADELGGQIANGAGAIALAVVSIVTSIKGRKALLATEPPA